MNEHLRNFQMQAAVRKVLLAHKLLGDKPGDGVVEADLIYAVLDNLPQATPKKPTRCDDPECGDGYGCICYTR